MTREKRSVILFYDLLELIETLDTNDAGWVILNLIEYELHNLDSELNSPILNTIANVGKRQLDKGRELFNKRFGD